MIEPFGLLALALRASSSAGLVALGQWLGLVCLADPVPRRLGRAEKNCALLLILVTAVPWGPMATDWATRSVVGVQGDMELGGILGENDYRRRRGIDFDGSDGQSIFVRLGRSE